MTNNMTKATLLLAAPRGFCAGVDRAIKIVEKALAKFGRPVYVRHEIVHNKFVVQSLENIGAIFVEELSEVPEHSVVIFSAHGVPKSVFEEAERRGLTYIDAACPLVTKVHYEAQTHFKNKRSTILIGHKGHPEVIGTMGQVPDGAITLIENADDVAQLDVPTDTEVAYITQTTLSVDDAAAIIEAIRAKFPHAIGPRTDDICYATTNRQRAVKELAKRSDIIFVVGAPNSSNTKRLVEVARSNGCQNSQMIQRASDIDFSSIGHAKVIGLTAGASAPEILVNEVIEALSSRLTLSIEYVTTAEENTHFKLPPILTDNKSTATIIGD